MNMTFIVGVLHYDKNAFRSDVNLFFLPADYLCHGYFPKGM